MRKTTTLRQRLGGSFGGAARLSMGSLTGQVIAFLATVIVARLYSPADVGVLSAVSAVALAISPLATLGLQVAIVPARNDGDALRLAQMALISTVAFSLVAVLFLTIFPLQGANLEERQSLVASFVPSMMFLVGAFAVLSQVALRHRQYSAMAFRGVLQSATIGGTQVGTYFVLPPPTGLFVGELVGRLVGVASLLPYAIRHWRSFSGKLPRRRQVLGEYKDAVRYFLPAAALEMAAVQSVVVLVAIWFGADEAGYVGLTMRVLAMPVVLIGTAVGQVLSTELSHRRRSGESAASLPRLRQLLVGLSASATAFAVGTVILGPWAFKVLFGPEWAPAGELARYLAVPMAIGIIWNPMSTVYGAHLRFRIFLGLTSTRFVLTVLVGLTLWRVGLNWVVVVVGMAVGTAVVQTLGIWIAWRIVATTDNSREEASA